MCTARKVSSGGAVRERPASTAVGIRRYEPGRKRRVDDVAALLALDHARREDPQGVDHAADIDLLSKNALVLLSQKAATELAENFGRLTDSLVS